MLTFDAERFLITEESSNAKIIALDVGGSHISAAVYDLSLQALGEVGHVLIPSSGTVEDFLSMLVGLCREVLPQPGSIAGLAAAMPSPFDYERGISYMKHKFQQLYGVNLRTELSRRVDCPPGSIHFLNDASAYLIGELRQGAAVGVDRVVGITLGTGIGSAFAAGGKVLREGVGVPPGGEIWNMPYLGGIAEDFAGTAAIQRIHAELNGGVRAQVHELAAAAAAGDPRALKTFQSFGAGLGKLLCFATAEFAPRRIVVGGGIARSATLFFPQAQRELADQNTELVVSQLGDRAPLVGAAMSWQDGDASAVGQHS